MEDVVFQNRVPTFWCDKKSPIGKPISILNKSGIVFVPAKTPLPEEINQLFPDSKRWTVSRLLDNNIFKTENILNSVIYAITLSNNEFIPNEEWSNRSIEHYLIPGWGGRLANTSKFNEIVNSIIRRSNNVCIVVCCKDGINQTCLAICTYLIQECFMKAESAYNLFIEKRELKPYSKFVIDRLKRLDPSFNVKPGIRPPINNDEISDLKIYLDYIPNLEKYGAHIVHNDNPLESRLLEFIHNSVGPGFSQTAYLPNPICDFWDNSHLDLIEKHAFRCTFTPEGSFFYVVAFTNDTLYLIHDIHMIWKVSIDIATPLPLVCSGVCIHRSQTVGIMLTDVHQIGDQRFDDTDLDDRLTALWEGVLPKININNNASIDIKFLFRPVARMNNATRLLNEVKHMYETNGFRCDGISFIQRTFPPGKSLFVPVFPSMKLYFALNAKNIAILYARTNDNARYVPFKYYEFNERYGALDRKVVRFKVKNGFLEPVVMYHKEHPDCIGYCEAMMKFEKGNFELENITEKCQEIAKIKAEQAKNKKKEKKLVNKS
ncbi:DSPc domain containing protein [Histomonas meleagridis]|uniref:DSPc domain containing protein n=1 Tax=Histomonas meleagridis TaxID=135588 RepID=UPI00355A56C4|nr:DSPc domain containing protein [Histomonas meleagridis]KAH0804591.1 DSPc domain containing protein [Histomonas meleagridis]